MLFAANTMVFFDRPIVEAIAKVAHCGFDCVEIWVDHLWDDSKGATIEEVKEIVTANKLLTTIHCPIMDINITSPNKGIRQESLRQTLQAIDLAKNLDSKLVVVHPGHLFSPRESLTTHWEYQVESIRQILDYGKQKQVIVTLENMDVDKNIVTVKSWSDLKRLYDDCAWKEQLVTLDTTHLKETNKILDFIETAGSNIVHLHLSDGNSQKMHLPLLTGELDLKRIAQALLSVGYEGICSLECFIPQNDENLLIQELHKAKQLFS